jgi:DNA primase
MAKIAQVSAKYIINAKILVDGVVDRPDVIGAIFGQTEGLLGSELELRELQRSGRIGRIEVHVKTKNGKTRGTITIPSSLDKAETAIIGAAMEIIDRIGPCNAKVKVDGIEDVRISKRQQVVDRAKSLLKDMVDKTMPDSQELSDEVAHSVRVMEIGKYGKENLPAGPQIHESDEIVVVEGRADVLNLLKHGFKNAISMNGTDVPQTIKDLSQKKIVTVFVDGDRGGDLIIKSLFETAEVDFVCKAPDGKEVEELTKKELHKGLRGKIAAEQYQLETGGKKSGKKSGKKKSSKKTKKAKLKKKEKEKFGDMLEDLIGTRGAYLLDEDLEVLGKVPVSELESSIESMEKGIHAVLFDGEVDKDIVKAAEEAGVNHVIGMKKKVKKAKINVATSDDLE